MVAKPGRKKKTLVTIEPPEPGKGRLKQLGGSASDDWNDILINQAIQTMWIAHSTDEELPVQCRAVASALAGIAPRDELEAMAAAQMIAAHNSAMECYRRAMIPDQTIDGRKTNLDQANKLSRTWAALLEALNKHRGKGQQKVTVEHVHVHAGGQAVVGAVESPTAGGGAPTEIKEQPHAKRRPQSLAQSLSHTSEPEMRRQDAEREPLPRSSDAERPLSDARGQGARRAKG